MPEEASRADVLAGIGRLEARVEGLASQLASEVGAVHRELAAAVLNTERRLVAIETDKDRWFKDTWPAASQVVQALADRQRALEQSALTGAALTSLHERLDRKDAADKEEVRSLKDRVAFLETWRWKMIGLSAGVATCGSLIAWLVTRLITHG